MLTFNLYHAGNKDAFEYQLKMVFFMLAIYACFGAYALNWVGVGWMAIIVSVLVTRWMIAFHILGGSLKALIGAITQHEQATFRYISANGLSQELAIMMGVRLVLFSTLFIISPSAFLTWWLVLRITYSINDFVFFHLVHYRSGVSGTFAIPLPLFLKLPALLIYGVDVVYATIHHDTHHNHPRVAAKHLPQVAKEINEQLGTSNP